MQAVRFHRYGSPTVLSCEEVPPPTVSPNEIRVAVHAAGVNPVDGRYRRGELKWIDWASFPRTPGADVAGIVQAVGREVTAFHVGDRVVAMLDILGGAGYAEQVCVPAPQASRAPDTISMIEAAGLPLVTLTAIQALRDKAHLTAGEHVLINGASGGVGTMAVQWAAAQGATVTGVCSHRNVALVQSLGADAVIDYTSEDPLASSDAFDVVFDTVGNQSIADAKAALRRNGRFVTTAITPRCFWDTLASRLTPGPTGYVVVVQPRGRDLASVMQMVEAGTLTPVVDRTYPLCDAAAAHQYSETKRAQGKIVLVTEQGRAG